MNKNNLRNLRNLRKTRSYFSTVSDLNFEVILTGRNNQLAADVDHVTIDLVGTA